MKGPIIPEASTIHDNYRTHKLATRCRCSERSPVFPTGDSEINVIAAQQVLGELQLWPDALAPEFLQ